jgi:hypothetical protein
MPGDEIVSKPSFNATRAVTIHAPAQNIYPWIVQMGVTRAGWYSYDLLDNLGRRSAESLLPEHQNIQIGDLIPISPDGKQGMWVKYFRKNKWMLWWDKKGDTTLDLGDPPRRGKPIPADHPYPREVQIVFIRGLIQPAHRILRHPDDAQIHAWHKKTRGKVDLGNTSPVLPQVVERNTPRLMDAAGECSL